MKGNIHFVHHKITMKALHMLLRNEISRLNNFGNIVVLRIFENVPPEKEPDTDFLLITDVLALAGKQKQTLLGLSNSFE